MLTRFVGLLGQASAALLIGLGVAGTTFPMQAEELQRTGLAPTANAAHGDVSIVQDPNEILEKKADLLMARHEYMSAIHTYEAVVSPSAQVLNKTGIAYEKMRLYPQAKLSYETAMAVSPRLSGPTNNLGTVYYAEGDYRKAERFYKKALKMEPRNASIYNNLGTLYFTKRKVHKGVEAYQQALSLDPEIFQRNAQYGIQANGSKESVAIINFYLAETCAQAGMNTAAIAYLRRAIDAGFHDQAKLRDDRNFAGLRQMPEFQSLFPVEK